MSTYFIPLAGIVIGSAGILYILIRRARSLQGREEETLVYPEVKKEQAEETGVVNDTQMRRGDAFIAVAEKFFRKVRIRLMRLENWLTGITNKLHERSSRKKDFLTEKEGNDGDKIIEKKEDRASFIALNRPDEKFDEQYWINILKHDTTSAYPYKKLGEIYVAREDFSEARSVLKYALRLDSSDEEAKGMLDGLKGKRTRRKIQSA